MVLSLQSGGLGGVNEFLLVCDCGFLKIYCELMSVCAFEDVRSIYMRVCCARRSLHVLYDVEDEAI